MHEQSDEIVRVTLFEFANRKRLVNIVAFAAFVHHCSGFFLFTKVCHCSSVRLLLVLQFHQGNIQGSSDGVTLMEVIVWWSGGGSKAGADANATDAHSDNVYTIKRQCESA